MSSGLSKPKPRPAPAKLPDPERKKLLCVNCAHHKMLARHLEPDVHGCKREGLFDQVDGKPLYLKCSAARNAETLCGTYARWFEPKEKS